ncbi:MAG: manganese efflux pump [Eubacteriaceae bacterium]|nr:manganese efflux pump [Eubacteriaceae bacterium]
MNFTTLLVTAVGLSMDASAVSISNGIAYRRTFLTKVILMAFYFGLFQAVMPFIGYYAGNIFSDMIKAVDHWVVLIILSILGIKMIMEAVKSKNSNEIKIQKCSFLTNKFLLIQALATSIDAFALGISLALIKVDILRAVIVIGITTFILCFFSFFVGRKFGSLFKSKAEIFGGLILIIIGLKIFMEHILS